MKNKVFRLIKEMNFGDDTRNSTMKINEVTSPLSKINKFLDDKKRKEEYARKLQKQRDEKDEVKEDFGSVPPLTDLIIMAVIAKTSVDVLKGMFKTAIATGKGLKKLNNLRKKAASIGQGVADYAMPESIDKTEIARKIAMSKDNNFKSAALAALERLVNSKGDKQSIGGYAFDIARAFAGIDAKELIRMYNEKHGE
jgi:hypothetical protein